MKRNYGPLLGCAFFLLSLVAFAKAKNGAGDFLTKPAVIATPAAKPTQAATFAFIPKLKAGATIVPYEKTPRALSFTVVGTVEETPTSAQNLLTLNLLSTDDQKTPYKVTINFGAEKNVLSAFKATIEAGAVGYMSVYYEYDSPYTGGSLTLPAKLTMDETWVLLRASKLAIHHPEAGFLVDEPLRQAMQNVPAPK